MLYQIYNHLALGPTAIVLGDYKSDIALVGCYNLYLNFWRIKLVKLLLHISVLLISTKQVQLLSNDQWSELLYTF